jgi:hypothetical protein
LRPPRLPGLPSQTRSHNTTPGERLLILHSHSYLVASYMSRTHRRCDIHTLA